MNHIVTIEISLSACSTGLLLQACGYRGTEPDQLSIYLDRATISIHQQARGGWTPAKSIHLDLSYVPEIVILESPSRSLVGIVHGGDYDNVSIIMDGLD
jgi:hypothetical protein